MKAKTDTGSKNRVKIQNWLSWVKRNLGVKLASSLGQGENAMIGWPSMAGTNKGPSCHAVERRHRCQEWSAREWVSVEGLGRSRVGIKTGV